MKIQCFRRIALFCRWLLLLVISCYLCACAQGRFQVDIVNDTTHNLDDVTCSFPNGGAVCGFLSPNIDKMSLTERPNGPIDLRWQEFGMNYRVEIPIKDGYIVFPEGILVLRIQTDHTVSVRGIKHEDWLDPPWKSLGDFYIASKCAPPDERAMGRDSIREQQTP